jgi:hypothetical protein
MKTSILGKAVPLLPSEADESIDLTDKQPRKIIKQAATDLTNGLQDTDRGEQVNAVYAKLKAKKKPQPPPKR